MIAPKGRLIFWIGMVMPFAAIGEIIPSTALLSTAIIGAALVLAITDALISRRRLNDIKVEFPEIVRVSKDHECVVDIYIENNTSKKRQLRVGLPFPNEIFSNTESMVLELPAEKRVSHFKWQCTPTKRGSYFFDKCYIEGSSYFGFWDVRAVVPAGFEIRVYPDLSFERKNLAALFLDRGNFGTHVLRHVGQGRDFEKLREYIHGDSYDHIHWKTTAKRGHPVTKVFQIERTQEVYVIIDASRLSGQNINNGMSTETTLERFVTAALIMGVAARRQGDFFGILSFSDRVHTFIRAKSGREHYNHCRDAIYKLQPRIVTPDFNELFAFIGLKLRRRALLVFLTNLDDPVISESFIRNMDLIRGKHLILVNMLRQEGIQPVFSNPDISSMDDIYGSLGKHMLWHNLLELEKIMQRKGVRFSMVSNERMSSQLVSQYLDLKQRQLI